MCLSAPKYFGLCLAVLVLSSTITFCDAQDPPLPIVSFEAVIAKPGWFLSVNGIYFRLVQGIKTDNERFQTIKTSMTDSSLQNIITGMSTMCSSMCLDVRHSDGPPATLAVTQIECNPGNMSQYWTQTPSPAEPSGSVYKWLKNFSTGHCATAEAEAPGNTVNSYVDDYACTGGAAHQLWFVSSPPDDSAGGSTVTNKAYGTCMQLKGGSPRSGATTVDAPCVTGEFFQHFSVVAAPKAYGYRKYGTNSCIDGGGGAGTPYTYSCVTYALNHQWLLARFPNDAGYSTYNYVVDMLSGYCLTMDPGNVNTITMAKCLKGNTSQQWRVSPSPG